MRYVKAAKIPFFTLIGTFLLLAFHTAASSQPEVKPEPARQSSAPGNYKIGPGDVIDVTLDNNDTLSRKGLRVSNQGTIQLAMIDSDVVAACRTERELADQIRDKYKKYLLNPHVTVGVKEFNSNPVAVIGAVNAPGRFQLQRPVRMLEILSLANGPSAAAGRTVQLIRNPRALVGCEGYVETPLTDDPGQPIAFRLAETLRASETANPVLQAGDIVRVLEAEQAYIQGNVRAAAIITLREPVTLSRAVAMAGGFAPGAQTEKIIIKRQDPGTLEINPITVNFKDITANKAEDIYLRPNDMIEVSGPRRKKFFNDFLQTILPAVTRLPLSIVP